MSPILLTPARQDLPDYIAHQRGYFFTRAREYSMMGYAIVAGLHTRVTADFLYYEGADLKITFHKFSGDLHISYRPLDSDEYKLVLFLLGDNKIATFREGERWVQVLKSLYQESEAIREVYLLKNMYDQEDLNFAPIED